MINNRIDEDGKIISFLKRLIGISDPPEGEPSNSNCKGRSYTNWESCTICPLCLSEPSHQEMMTDICLSCGKQSNMLGEYAAKRKVFFNGRWRHQLRYRGYDYIDGVRK